MNPPEAPPPPFAVPIPERMGAATSVCVIANPGAGRGGRRAALEAAVDRWARRGWTIRWRTTGAPGDATAMARSAAADGVDVVAVAGGDGTVNEAVNGLVGARAALAVLPSGTANVLAAQLGLVPWPSPWRTPDLGAAADALAAGVVRSVDLGFAEPAGRPGRHFVMWAGVGADAAVVAALEEPGHKALKARLGAVAYAIAGVRVLLSDRGGRAMVCVDGVRRRGRLRCAVVNNIPLYAGLVHLAPEARLDDGRLDAALFMGASRLRAAADWLSAGGVGTPPAFGRRVLRGRADTDRALSMGCASLIVASRPPLHVHLDAEPWGTTPVRISVRRGALRLLVPAGAPDGLFGAADDPGAAVGTLEHVSAGEAWPALVRPAAAR